MSNTPTKDSLERELTITWGVPTTLHPVDSLPDRAVTGQLVGVTEARLFYTSRRTSAVRTTTTYLYHHALGRFLVRTNPR